MKSSDLAVKLGCKNKGDSGVKQRPALFPCCWTGAGCCCWQCCDVTNHSSPLSSAEKRVFFVSLTKERSLLREDYDQGDDA
jgi:hypothetical protein